MTLATFLSNLSIPFQWWVVIAPWERGIRIRCGKNARVLDPGLHFKIPFLDRVYVVGVRLRMISDTGQTMRTRDGKPVTVNVSISFSIGDVLRLYNTISNPESTLCLTAQAAVARAISEVELEELTPDAIEAKATAAIPGTAWGLADVAVKITSMVNARTYRLMMHEYRSNSGLDAALAIDDDKRARA